MGDFDWNNPQRKKNKGSAFDNITGIFGFSFEIRKKVRKTPAVNETLSAFRSFVPAIELHNLAPCNLHMQSNLEPRLRSQGGRQRKNDQREKRDKRETGTIVYLTFLFNPLTLLVMPTWKTKVPTVAFSKSKAW